MLVPHGKRYGLPELYVLLNYGVQEALFVYRIQEAVQSLSQEGCIKRAVQRRNTVI
jgi:hypothetical protein